LEFDLWFEGWNIEQMASYMPLSDFDTIYLIDLCEPLLDVARKRFAAKGWTNVICLKQDASEFVLPEWEAGQDPRGSLTVATLSYSLSMVSSFRFPSELDAFDDADFEPCSAPLRSPPSTLSSIESTPFWILRLDSSESLISTSPRMREQRSRG